MQFAHILFLSLYSLQAAGSYINVDVQHEIAKRAPHKGKGHSGGSGHKEDPNSSGSANTESSGNGESSQGSSGNEGSTKKTTSATTPTTSLTSHPTSSTAHPTSTSIHSSSTTTHASSTTTHASSTSTHDSQFTSAASTAQPTFKNKKDKANYLKKFGSTVKDLAIDSIGGIIVGAAVNEITGGSSESSSESGSDAESEKEEQSMVTVQFITSGTDGSAETTTVTAPPSAFSTATDGQLFIKTDQVSVVSAAESSLLNN